MPVLNYLTGKNIFVYDLEIKKEIVECTNGWMSHNEMGISVACGFDYREMKYRVFMDDNITELVDRLNEPGTIVVAFNHINFDNKLLRVNGLKLKPDADLKNYDMMRVSKMGASSSEYSVHKGFKLDDHLRENKLPLKTANGALAPGWFKTGKMGKLILSIKTQLC